MDGANNNAILPLARVQDAAHVGTDVVYGIILAIDIVDSDIITFKLHGDTVSRGYPAGLCRFDESRRFLTVRW